MGYVHIMAKIILEIIVLKFISTKNMLISCISNKPLFITFMFDKNVYLLRQFLRLSIGPSGQDKWFVRIKKTFHWP